MKNRCQLKTLQLPVAKHQPTHKREINLMDFNALMQTLGTLVVVSPAILLAVLGVPSLLGKPQYRGATRC